MGSAPMSMAVQLVCALGCRSSRPKLVVQQMRKPSACLTTVATRLTANPTPPSCCLLPIAMAAAATSRRFFSIFSSTKPRARPLKPAVPELAPAPKAPAGQAGAKPDERRESRNLTKMLNVIFRERDPGKLVSRFIAKSTSSERFRDEHRVYEATVARLACFRRHDAIASIMDSQKPFIESSNAAFAARLIRLWGRASMPSHASAIFHDLPPKHKSDMTFNALLLAYIYASDYDALATAFQQIPASHPTIVPTVNSYNILISALCKKPDLTAALDVITLMEKHGVSPDIISSNTLLNGFYNNESKIA